jgi:hypothetical protein
MTLAVTEMDVQRIRRVRKSKRNVRRTHQVPLFSQKWGRGLDEPSGKMANQRKDAPSVSGRWARDQNGSSARSESSWLAIAAQASW